MVHKQVVADQKGPKTLRYVSFATSHQEVHHLPERGQSGSPFREQLNNKELSRGGKPMSVHSTFGSVERSNSTMHDM